MNDRHERPTISSVSRSLINRRKEQTAGKMDFDSRMQIAEQTMAQTAQAIALSEMESDLLMETLRDRVERRRALQEEFDNETDETMREFIGLQIEQMDCILEQVKGQFRKLSEQKYLTSQIAGEATGSTNGHSQALTHVEDSSDDTDDPVEPDEEPAPKPTRRRRRIKK